LARTPAWRRTAGITVTAPARQLPQHFTERFGQLPWSRGWPGSPSIVRLALKYAPMSEAENNVETETFRRLERLRELRIEHRDLDDVIHRLQMDIYVNEVQLRRLKKRKLMLKDQIARLESELIPDLNA
jgi:hypothetical protein